MPELPEVETIRRGLDRHASGHVVLRVVGDGSRVFRDNPGGFRSVESLIDGRRIEAFDRRGKFMWMRLEGEPAALVIHLGMSGQVRFSHAAGSQPAPAHEHLRLILDRGALSFVDPRTFGRLTVSPLEQQGGREVPMALAHIAMDPLEPGWDPASVADRARRSRRLVKTMLLDQELVSGIGNIYADEALFRAGVPGVLRGEDLSAEQWITLVAAAGAAMREATEVGGTSFDALYVDALGNPGYFSRELAVYGREGQACIRCGATIERRVLNGRSHFFCPRCQHAEHLALV